MTKRTTKNHKPTLDDTRNKSLCDHERDEHPKRRRLDLNQCAGFVKLLYWVCRIFHEQDGA